MPTANRPQCEFHQLKTKNRAFVGGYGSGKTWVGCQAMSIHHLEHPRIGAGYFAPTYPMIHDIFYPTIDEVAAGFDMRTEIKEGNKEVHFYRGGRYRGTTICRSMEDPNKIIGFKVGYAMVDELDTMPMVKAQLAWRKILARMRSVSDDVRNGIDVTTTPEGFRATHKIFVTDVQARPDLAKNYGLVQASTYDNEANLPPDYIPSLYEAYTKELVDAYIRGRFTNLTSGTIYRNFDRYRCASTESIRTRNERGEPAPEPLLIGMDFNVTKMAATIYVQRANGWHAVAELHDVFDTPEMIRIIKERWAKHRIIVYPDPTGKNRETVDASRSDLALLYQAGFEVRVNHLSPAVKDRINATNKQFEIGRLWVNAAACPTVVRCLEAQIYDDNGEPDKKSGFDHQNDATSYPVVFEHPIVHAHVQRAVVAGV